MEKTMHFFTAAIVFFNVSTFTKHRISRYESYFLIFRICAFFFLKKHRKKCPKFKPCFFPPVFLNSRAREAILGAKVNPNDCRRGQKPGKSWQQVVFGPIRFPTFLRGAKTLKLESRKSVPGGVEKPTKNPRR